ncbi:hypothetical protein [Synechococcus sp. PCC 7502]|uniref:hypothetical protein n=1 Tax=Synechococcus sp. PCC 7502 TaxID=1173263 RepID=UPI00059B95C1|nr:hypothetical protein [Synechococcus sp. PCC 7502]
MNNKLNNKFKSFNSLLLKLGFAISLNLVVTLLGDHGFALATPNEAQLANTLNRQRSNFILCPQDCDRSEFYIGYNRTNTVRLGQKVVSSVITKTKFLLNIANLMLQTKLPNVDVATVDNRDGNFVSSIHRIESLQIGFSEKSELLQVYTRIANTAAEATVKLFWGDTFIITSSQLPKGTPVKVIVERALGGFGNPVTENAYYQAIAKTYVSQRQISNLDFSVTKKPGTGETDQVSGKDTISYILDTKVGEKFTIESSLQVLDGLKGSNSGNQILNGADSVMYKINLTDEFRKNACLKSASKTFVSGSCQ